MLLHSADYLELFSVLLVAWQWLAQAAAAREGLSAGRGPLEFYEGMLCAALYWFATELPRIGLLIPLCRENDDTGARTRPDWF